MSAFSFPAGDDLADMLNTPVDPQRLAAAVAAPLEGFVESCPACKGTGKFRSYSGRILGDCFKCSGKGKQSFKTSAATRQAGRDRAANRQQAALDAFKAAQPRAFAWIEASAGFQFADDMKAKIAKYGDLTPNQLAACVRAADKRDAAKAAREVATASAPVVSMDKLIEAFAHATEKGAKSPKIRLAGLTISPAKASSANAGALYVKGDGGRYLGKIAAGKFLSSRECTADDSARLLAAAADPLAAAVAYGQATGSCSCCGRELTDPESIAAGIGPICADKFGF